MKQNRFSYSRVFWILVLAYVAVTVLAFSLLAVTPVPQSSMPWHKLFTWRTLLSNVVSLLFSSAYYYFALNAFYRLIIDRKSFISYLKPIGVSVVSITIYSVLKDWAFSDYKAAVQVNTQLPKQAPVELMVMGWFLVIVFYICISMVIAYFTSLQDERKQRKVLESQKRQLELEKTNANFNFLKAQINPHFLHNTLNFLYAKALPLSADLSEGILTLSDIMRYALSDTNLKDGKALLKDEIDHVRNVIKIQQLRFGNKLNVKFDVEGVINGATIVPFVLITLVENAFKHGDLQCMDEPITIQLRVEEGTLYFYCRNRKKKGPKELSTGIGLDNIKKRLDLTYKNHYTFNVKDENDHYTTELTIDRV